MVGGGRGEVGRITELPDGSVPAPAILSGAIVAYYSFVGFETSANVAEEIRNPAKVYPAALFGALITAGVMYALVAVANGALLTMIMASRLTYGMAEHRLLPSVLGRVLPNRRTPWAAILATTLVAMLLTLTGDLSTLAETVVLLLLVVFISTNVAVLVLRRDTVAHDHFRVWTAIPVLGVASCLLLMTQQSGKVWLFAAILMAVGVVLYVLARAATRRSAV